MKLVIGLIGRPLVGKGTVARITRRLLEDWGYTVSDMRFSDVLNDVLKNLSIPNTRENLQNLVIALKNVFGGDVLTNAVKKRALASPADVVILDGVRWPPDLAMIKTFPQQLTIYVTADLRLTFERTRKREEKSGENEMTWEEFLRMQGRETETHIETLGQEADIRIENNDEDDTSPSAPRFLVPKLEMILNNVVVPILQKLQ